MNQKRRARMEGRVRVVEKRGLVVRKRVIGRETMKMVMAWRSQKPANLKNLGLIFWKR